LTSPSSGGHHAVSDWLLNVRVEFGDGLAEEFDLRLLDSAKKRLNDVNPWETRAFSFSAFSLFETLFQSRLSPRHRFAPDHAHPWTDAVLDDGRGTHRRCGHAVRAATRSSSRLAPSPRDR
jgi:hypothetical protein